MAHTSLTVSVWFGVMEAEDLYQFKLASLMATASIGAHPDLDVSHSQAVFGKLYEKALYGMPYSFPVEGPSEEVMRAVDAYRQWKKFFDNNKEFDIKLT
jgi:hypothetical protein